MTIRPSRDRARKTWSTQRTLAPRHRGRRSTRVRRVRVARHFASNPAFADTAAAPNSVLSVGAPHLGPETGLALRAGVVGIASNPAGRGYWLVGSDGGVFAFGNAGFFGSTGNDRLNAPIVGIAATSNGRGYWLVANDGGVFAFGDARFHGSTAGLPLAAPIVAIVPTKDDGGYWLVAADGGVFAFGNAHFHGSAVNLNLASPIVGATGTTAGHGYWLVGADGGVFAFGDAHFHGSDHDMQQPAVGIAAATERSRLLDRPRRRQRARLRRDACRRTPRRSTRRFRTPTPWASRPAPAAVTGWPWARSTKRRRSRTIRSSRAPVPTSRIRPAATRP